MVGGAAVPQCARLARWADAAALRHPPAHLAGGCRDDAADVPRSVARGARTAESLHRLVQPINAAQSLSNVRALALIESGWKNASRMVQGSGPVQRRAISS